MPIWWLFHFEQISQVAAKTTSSTSTSWRWRLTCVRSFRSRSISLRKFSVAPRALLLDARTMKTRWRANDFCRKKNLYGGCNFAHLRWNLIELSPSLLRLFYLHGTSQKVYKLGPQIWIEPIPILSGKAMRAEYYCFCRGKKSFRGIVHDWYKYLNTAAICVIIKC